MMDENVKKAEPTDHVDQRQEQTRNGNKAISHSFENNPLSGSNCTFTMNFEI